MIHDPIRAEWHAIDCRCRACTPRSPADRAAWERRNAISLRLLAGFALALPAIELFAWISGAPGVAVIFGAR